MHKSIKRRVSGSVLLVYCIIPIPQTNLTPLQNPHVVVARTATDMIQRVLCDSVTAIRVLCCPILQKRALRGLPSDSRKRTWAGVKCDIPIKTLSPLARTHLNMLRIYIGCGRLSDSTF